jgi:cytoskeleton protein RodZ
MRNKSVKKSKHVVESDAPDPGARLRAAREALGASVDEVAHDLHLEREVILSLESADYESLGAPVFVRGYMRSYARLMELPEDDIVESFVVPLPEPEEFRSLSARTEVKPGASMANFVLWMLLAIVALAGIVYLLIGDGQAPAGTTDKGEFVAPPKPAPEVGSDAEEVAPEISPEVEPTVIEPVVVIELPPEPVVVASIPVQLTLSFAEECWVEVSDTKNRLLYGLEKPNTTVTVEGEPPFRLFVGNVQGVSLQLNGEAFSVPRASRSGNNTARFTINENDVPGAKQQ